MRSLISSGLEVAGSVALVVGAATTAVCLGWIVGGAVALVWAWRLAK